MVEGWGLGIYNINNIGTVRDKLENYLIGCEATGYRENYYLLIKRRHLTELARFSLHCGRKRGKIKPSIDQSYPNSVTLISSIGEPIKNNKITPSARRFRSTLVKYY